MSVIIDLLVLAIIIPGLALFGHLYVAYRFAPERAKRAILDALTGDESFQSDLMKSILANLFREVKDGDRSVVPIDAMIARAKTSFADWIKSEIPKVDPSQTAMMMQPTQDEYGNPVQPDIFTNILLANIPKKYRGYAMMAMKYLGK